MRVLSVIGDVDEVSFEKYTRGVWRIPESGRLSSLLRDESGHGIERRKQVSKWPLVSHARSWPQLKWAMYRGGQRVKSTCSQHVDSPSSCHTYGASQGPNSVTGIDGEFKGPDPGEALAR
ncbi:hypothetical protein ACLOJK_021740 [Asimina triloba]